jgi:enoyl-CoA hydratase/carnithine racemase
MTFSGRIVEAQEALSLGIFLELLSSEQLMPRALEMAKQFSTKPREALRMSKRLLQSGHRMGLQDFLDYCASQQGLCHTSDQHLNALAGFLNK